MIMLVVFLPDGVIRDRLRGGIDLGETGVRVQPDPRQPRPAAAAGRGRRYRLAGGAFRGRPARSWSRPSRTRKTRETHRSDRCRRAVYPIRAPLADGVRSNVVDSGGEGAVRRKWLFPTPKPPRARPPLPNRPCRRSRADGFVGRGVERPLWDARARRRGCALRICPGSRHVSENRVAIRRRASRPKSDARPRPTKPLPIAPAPAGQGRRNRARIRGTSVSFGYGIARRGSFSNRFRSAPAGSRRQTAAAGPPG